LELVIKKFFENSRNLNDEPSEKRGKKTYPQPMGNVHHEKHRSDPTFARGQGFRLH
jgi:hypothetical protein